jgi:simple sugar transport system permease protein
MNARGGGDSVHALLLFVAVILIGVAIWQLARLRTTVTPAELAGRATRNAYLAAGVSLTAAAALLLWFFRTDVVPGELVSFTPHLTTLLVLALASQRLRAPAADGEIYRRGEAR